MLGTQIIDVTGKANPLGLPATYTTTPYTSVKFYLKDPASGIADTPLYAFCRNVSDPG